MEIKPIITDGFAPNMTFYQDFLNIVGNENDSNVHNYPWDAHHPVRLEMSLGDKFIQPFAYALMGRAGYEGSAEIIKSKLASV